MRIETKSSTLEKFIETVKFDKRFVAFREDLDGIKVLLAVQRQPFEWAQFRIATIAGAEDQVFVFHQALLVVLDGDSFVGLFSFSISPDDFEIVDVFESSLVPRFIEMHNSQFVFSFTDEEILYKGRFFTNVVTGPKLKLIKQFYSTFSDDVSEALESSGPPISITGSSPRTKRRIISL